MVSLLEVGYASQPTVDTVNAIISHSLSCQNKTTSLQSWEPRRTFPWWTMKQFKQSFCFDQKGWSSRKSETDNPFKKIVFQGRHYVDGCQYKADRQSH